MSDHALLVESVMTEALATVGARDRVRQAEGLMKRYAVDHLPVVQGGRLVGLLSALHIEAARPAALTSLTADAAETAVGRIRVGAIMTSPVLRVAPHTPLVEAARLMHDGQLAALPVLRDGRVVGILTDAVLLECLASSLERSSEPLGSGADRLPG